MNKKRNYGKIVFWIIIFIIIVTLAIIGITSLIKAFSETNSITEPVDNGVLGENPVINPDINESGKNDSGLSVVEDKEVGIVFNGDSLEIENIGDDYQYAVHTGNYRFSLHIFDRKTEEYGIFETTGGNIFSSYTISEESNGVLITAASSDFFTISEPGNGKNVTFDFIKQVNNEVLEYRNDLDRHYLNLVDARFTQKSDSENKYYTEIFDDINLIRSIIIDKKYMPELIDEKLIFNDGYIRYLEIINENEKVRFNFAMTEDLIIYPNSRDYDAALTLIKPSTEGRVIVIDPGHGGIDGGAVSADQKIIEKNIVLDISFKLVEYLKEMGFIVYNLREEDVFLGLMERTDIANLLKADAIISIHINSFIDPSVSGTLTLYKTSSELAGYIQSEVVGRTYSVNMGSIKKLDLSILNRAEMDSVIVECGFVTNEMEADKLCDNEYQEKIAEGIAEGIKIYYSGLKE